MNRKLLAFGSMVIVAALIGGCSGNTNKTDRFADSGKGEFLADAPEQVQNVYKQNCLSCHGGNLEGRVGPKTNLQKTGSRLNEEQIAKQITNGGNGMPSFGAKLKPEEVSALAAWLAGKK